jgi:S-adenosylmethionine hydrolase
MLRRRPETEFDGLKVENGPFRLSGLILLQMGKSTITLTTDFGTKDGYVGAVKGVIKRISPEADVVDITHGIEPFGVLAAAFALNNFYGYFPPGSIHLVVVDPGVGGGRQPLLIQSEEFLFVGPDNGVFSFVYQRDRIKEIVVLSNKKYFLAELSSTFHARDIFAPAAAYLSLGVDPKEFGERARECHKLIIPEPEASKKALWGQVIHVDSFGNLITNIESDLLKKKNVVRMVVGRRQIKPIARSYSDIPEGQVGALAGSSGYLEIAANQDSAQDILKSRVGTAVRITFR